MRTGTNTPNDIDEQRDNKYALYHTLFLFRNRRLCADLLDSRLRNRGCGSSSRTCGNRCCVRSHAFQCGRGARRKCFLRTNLCFDAGHQIIFHVSIGLLDKRRRCGADRGNTGCKRSLRRLSLRLFREAASLFQGVNIGLAGSGNRIRNGDADFRDVPLRFGVVRLCGSISRHLADERHAVNREDWHGSSDDRDEQVRKKFRYKCSSLSQQFVYFVLYCGIIVARSL